MTVEARPRALAGGPVETHDAAPAWWDDVAVRSPGGHVLQSSAWARIRAGQGWRPEFVRLGDPLPVALVLWRAVPILGRVAYVPRGPVVATHDAEALERALRSLASLARERGAVFLKVDPELSPDEAGRPLARAGFRRGPDVQPALATLVLDLRDDLDTVMAKLDKDTRWSVRQAPKRGVSVRAAGDDAGLRAFYELYAGTGRRAGFITRTWEYYRTVWRTLVDAGLATLRLAYIGGDAVAAAMTWRCGDREIYMYGASNDRARRSFASYGLQWECIAAAKARGARRYDLGGIPADPSRKDDPMYGPYLFKRGFGGDTRHYVGAHDAVSRPLAYAAFRATEPLFTRALRLARRRAEPR